MTHTSKSIFHHELISFIKSEKHILMVFDSGIGMNEADFVENLVTIARSVTRALLEKFTCEACKDSNLFGQFDVGFYSLFMIAKKVEIIRRHNGGPTPLSKSHLDIPSSS